MLKAESDSLNVIEFRAGQSRWWDTTAAIFAKCIKRSYVSGKLTFRYSFCFANQAVHVLANYNFVIGFCLAGQTSLQTV